MIKKIISTFILTIFSLGIVIGDVDFSTTDTPAVKTIKSISSELALSQTHDCEDCKDKDCSHKEECSHHCSGVHQFAPINHTDTLNNITKSLSKIKWLYYHLYNPPFIDPSLKPPTFS